MHQAICKLCNKPKQLIRAHIIPRHFFLEYEKEGFYAINPSNGKMKQWQCGIYDKRNILCKTCDGDVLGEFDKEGYRVLLSEVYNHKYIEKEKGIVYHLEEKDFNFEYLRKFFIAILWKASISPEQEVSNINLGIYEQKAYEVLKNINTHNDLFKIAIFKAPKNRILNKTVYMRPVKFCKDCNAYQIVMAGYEIYIVLNSKKIPIYEFKQYNRIFMCKEHLYIFESEDVYNDNMQYLLSYAKGWKK